MRGATDICDKAECVPELNEYPRPARHRCPGVDDVAFLPATPNRHSSLTLLDLKWL
jgi:hypothetical protein